VNWLRRLSPVLVLLLAGCAPVGFDETSRPVPSVTQSPREIDADTFWSMMADARARGNGDPDAMADALDYPLYDANDQTVRSFQAQFVAASIQLYTWRTGEAAELICGSMDDDDFVAWRTWVISLGRETFESVVENPDNIADVQVFDDGCGDWFDPISWVASDIWQQRHPDSGDPVFSALRPATDPAGVRLHGDKAIRAALPKVAART
jgi:hypothetical protein